MYEEIDEDEPYDEDWVDDCDIDGSHHQQHLARILTRNFVAEGDGFHVSYYPYSLDYGCDTTALVAGQGQRFYILNGDHAEQMTGYQFSTEKLTCSFESCLAYLHEHADQLNAESEALPPLGSSVADAIRIGWHLRSDCTVYWIHE